VRAHSIKLLRRETSDLIIPNLWLRITSHTLVDYKMLAVLKEWDSKPMRDVDELRERLVDSWSSVQRTAIDQLARLAEKFVDKLHLD